MHIASMSLATHLNRDCVNLRQGLFELSKLSKLSKF
jgi:hypothetical protein